MFCDNLDYCWLIKFCESLFGFLLASKLYSSQLAQCTPNPSPLGRILDLHVYFLQMLLEHFRPLLWFIESWATHTFLEDKHLKWRIACSNVSLFLFLFPLFPQTVRGEDFSKRIQYESKKRKRGVPLVYIPSVSICRSFILTEYVEILTSCFLFLFFFKEGIYRGRNICFRKW